MTVLENVPDKQTFLCVSLNLVKVLLHRNSLPSISTVSRTNTQCKYSYWFILIIRWMFIYRVSQKMFISKRGKQLTNEHYFGDTWYNVSIIFTSKGCIFEITGTVISTSCCCLLTPAIYRKSFMNILLSGLSFHDFLFETHFKTFSKLHEELDSKSGVYSNSVQAKLTLGYLLSS